MKINREKFNKIKKEAKSFLSGAKGSHDWEHTERVYNLCLRIAKKEKADKEILSLAAILHDIGRPEQDKSNGKICHAKRGVVLARWILEKYNFKKEKIDKIVHCVECHRFKDDKIPQTKEAKILYDADKLDAVGATGIGRAFLFAGEIGAKFHNKGIDIEKTKEYSKDDTAYREYMVTLKKIKNKIMTKTGREIARQRHEFMEKFFERLDKEVEGIL